MSAGALTPVQLVEFDVRRPTSGRPAAAAVDELTPAAAAALAALRQLAAAAGPRLARPGRRSAVHVPPDPISAQEHLAMLALVVDLRASDVPWREIASAAGRSPTCEAGRKLHRRLVRQVSSDHQLHC